MRVIITTIMLIIVVFVKYIYGFLPSPNLLNGIIRALLKVVKRLRRPMSENLIFLIVA